MTNIALIIHDTLRKDAFDEYFNWLPGTRFDNAWSPSHWTAPVHASIFTGLYPSDTGVYRRTRQFDKPDAVLAEILAEHGYTTRAFSANANISKQAGFDRGFEQFLGPWKTMPFNRDIIDIRSSTSGKSGVSKYTSVLTDIARGDCDTLPSLSYAARRFLDSHGIKSGAGDSGAAEALGLH